MNKKLLSLLLVPFILAAQEKPLPNEAEIQRMNAAMPKTVLVKPAKPRKVLVYCDHRGFYHTSIPFCSKALELLGKSSGAFEVVAVTEDASCFEPENLKDIDVIFLNNNTSRSPWGQVNFAKMPAGPEREKAEAREARLRKSFVDFVRNGKGVVGLHAATDAMYDWPEYGEILGGFFNAHPWSETVGVELVDPGHGLMRGWRGQNFSINDEIYQQKEPYSRDSQRVLMRLDTSRTNMNKDSIRRKDGDFGLAWIKTYGQGRSAYIAFGHRHEIFWNPAVLTMMLDVIQFAAGDLKVDTRPSNQVDEATLAQSRTDGFKLGVKAICEELAGYRYSVNDTAAKQIETLINHLEFASREADARIVASELAALLTPQTTVDCRNLVLRELSRIGGAAEVPAIATQISSRDTVVMALYALQRMDAPEATAALVDALKSTPGQADGILRSLGHKADAATLPAIQSALMDAPEAAVFAMGQIGTPEAAKVLIDLLAVTPVPVAQFAKAKRPVLSGANPAFRKAVYGALAKCVETTAGEASRPAAQALSDATAPLNLRAKGMERLFVLDGVKAIPAALQVLQLGDSFSRASAARALAQFPGGLQAAMAALNSQASLPVESAQFLFNELIAFPALEPEAIKALTNANDTIAIAAARALETIGTGAAVLPLAAVPAGPRQGAARRAIERMGGKGVNDVLLAEINNLKNEATTRANLIATLGARKTGTAAIFAPLVLQDDAAVRKEAIPALALVAKADDMQLLANLIRDAKTSGDRKKLETIAIAAGRRAEQPAVCSGVLIRCLDDKALAEAVRISYITILGKIADTSALPVLTASAADASDAIKRAGILSLSEWPTPAPLQTLRSISLDANASQAHKVLALRGYAHLLALPSNRSIQDTLAMYREALNMAKEPMEKQSLINGLGDLVHPDALKLAMSFVAVPELTDEAILSASKILNGLSGSKLVVRASQGGAPRNAIDSNRKTRWTSGAKQAGGEWFMVDMGYETSFEELYLDAGDEGNDYPAAYEIYVSKDGETWGKPILSGKSKDGDRQMTLKLNGYGRYLKILQTGTTPHMYWSICEMRINGMPQSGGKAVPSDQLKLSASNGNESIGNAIDGKLTTRWTSGAPMKTGMWFQIELPQPAKVKRIAMNSAGSKSDFARGFRVEISDDGKTWKGPYSMGKGESAMVNALLLDNTAKFVRIVLTESDTTYFWSIHDLNVFVE